MVRVFLFLSFLFIHVAAFADVHGFACIKKVSAKELSQAMAALEKRYSSVNTIRARFAQYAFLEALDSSEISQGIMIFQKPGKMHWSYEDPEPQEFVADGKTLWFFQPVDNQVMIDNFRTAMRGDLPVSFLLGLGSLSRDFKIEGGCESDTGTVLNLLPNKSEDEVSKLKILVEKGTALPVGAEIIDAAGNKNSFVFSQMEVDPKIDAAIFNPKVPKGTDIIDNRRLKQSS